MRRKRRKSPAKDGSRKEPAGGASQTARSQPRPSSGGFQAGHWSTRKIWIAASAAGVISAVAGLGFYLLNGRESVWSAPDTVATYVGSETCAGCHRAQAELWHTSQHTHAMDHATDKSVLGDFNDASFDYYGVHSRFFHKSGKFLVETDGPDGELATFEVKYTFGIDPLQQYLVEFPDGRLQALHWLGKADRRSRLVRPGLKPGSNRWV